MKFFGKTIDNNIVVIGVFELVGTYGVPLEIILMIFRNKGIIIDWVDYINHALKDGAKLNTIKARISSAVGDLYGATYRDEVIKKIDKHFGGVCVAGGN